MPQLASRQRRAFATVVAFMGRCRSAVFPKGVLARARDAPSKRDASRPGPCCARQGKTGLFPLRRSPPTSGLAAFRSAALEVTATLPSGAFSGGDRQRALGHELRFTRRARVNRRDDEPLRAGCELHRAADAEERLARHRPVREVPASIDLEATHHRDVDVPPRIMANESVLSQLAGAPADVN
jgi:hypothetical protein